MRNQLVKDLEGFDCDVCPNNERLNSRGVKECWEWDGGACVEYALQWVADRLSDLGCVKVVLCRDCWKWGKDDCPVGDSWDDSDFCCYGEAKEGTNDAV